MRILFLSQVFWPDNVSTAQHLYDLGVELVDHGHEVSVICSRFSYEDTSIEYPRWENHHNIKIKRLRNTKFGKSNIAGRLIDFLSFNLLLYVHLKRREHYDLILGMTSPPLVSYIGILFAKKRKIKFCYWTMDLQPELAIASGMIKEHSISAYFLKRMADRVIKNADLLISLDNYMKEYLVKRGAVPKRIKSIPVWPVTDERYTGERLNNSFRLKHGFGDKIVIMYSGNHAYVHPLDTLLEAAKQLKEDARFVFVFIGEGVRKKDVSNFKLANNLDNIMQLPYEPRSNIHNSLGAADLQVVILGEGQVGYTHPNKIYGAMFIGKPIIYIGPEVSHVSDILNQLPGNIQIREGANEKLVECIKQFAVLPDNEKEMIGEQNLQYAIQNFSPSVLKKQMRLAITEINTQNFDLLEISPMSTAKGF